MWEVLLSYLFRDVLDADGPVGLLGPSRKSAGAGEGGRTGNEEGQGGGGGGGCRQEGDKGRGEGEAGHSYWGMWLRWRSGRGKTGQQWLGACGKRAARDNIMECRHGLVWMLRGKQRQAAHPTEINA
jgi:hypothetical protein